MNFNKHSHLEGLHAFLSPSKYHWVNYTDEKLQGTFLNYQAAARGTRLHDFAKECIELGIKLPRSRKTLNMYVNDAIGFRMIPEQILFYSDNCFGTADAISFKKEVLRIHDLKNGVSPVSMKQLEVYVALFCLEYDISINDIHVELRIYHMDDVLIHEPESETIKYIMTKIIDFDRQIETLKINNPI